MKDKKTLIIIGVVAVVLILLLQGQPKEIKKTAGELSSRRFQRSTIYNNQPTTVNISLTAGTSGHWIVEERVPTGWTVTSASDSGDYTTTPGKIFWIVLTAPTIATYNYTVNPNNNLGSQQFTGIVKFEDISTTEIDSVNNTLNVVSCTSSTETCDNIDNDCDYSIDESLSRSCGSGGCIGTQTCTTGSWGTCSSYNSDCGVCCKCSSAGAETYDSTQNSDCTATTCPSDGCALGGCGTHIFSDYLTSVANSCSGLKSCTSNLCTATCTADSDSDGWAGSISSFTSCYDCNNNDNTIFYSNPESCGDNKDNDCSGIVESYFNKADWGLPNGFCLGTLCCDNKISIEELSTGIEQYKTAGWPIEDLSSSISKYKTG